MRITVWNCRGLGRPRTVQELTRLVRVHCPEIVFLSETRQGKHFVEGVGRRIGFRHSIIVSMKGKGAGLALFWDDSVDVELINYGIHHVDVKVSVSGEIKWRGTFVYGEPRSQDRHCMWDLLRRIKSNASEPWLMIGDFNEAMWQSEHISRKRRSEPLMKAFREVLS